MQRLLVNLSFIDAILVMKPKPRAMACLPGNAIGLLVIRHYRGHRIVVHCDMGLTAEIAELKSMQTLPTMATATRAEGPEVCLARAKELVDLYCGPAGGS